MSRILYDFLAESLLFQHPSAERHFDRVSQVELGRELKRYAQHVEEHDVARGSARDELAILFECTGGVHPSMDDIKKAVLYFDHAYVDDPLYALAKQWHHFSNPTNECLTGTSFKTARVRVAEAVSYLRKLTPLVAADVLSVVPLDKAGFETQMTYLSLDPARLPQGISERIADWLIERAKIIPLEAAPSRGSIARSKPSLEHLSRIAVSFDGQMGVTYFMLMKPEAFTTDEDGGRIQMIETGPENPFTADQTAAWIRESSLATGMNLVNSITRHVAFAEDRGAYLMPQSRFVSDFLVLDVPVKDDPRSSVNHLQMMLELPHVQSVSISELLQLREAAGDSLSAFRQQLRSKLLGLRHLEDPGELRDRLRDVTFEITDGSIREFEGFRKRSLRELTRNAVIGAVGLTVAVASGSLTLGGALATAAVGGLSLDKAAQDIAAHPAYFSWRLLRKHEPSK